MIYRHKKTGNLYKAWIFDAINCTNAQDGQVMVIYKRALRTVRSDGEPPTSPCFVREANEFYEKFERVDNARSGIDY